MTILHLPTTISTMDVAKQLVTENDTTTTIVMADHQTASRGRHNRPWLTFGAPYSLQATYILRPHHSGGGQNAGPHLPLIVALALYDALLPYAPEPALRIKWPNDILLNGKKLSGILCENVGNGAGQGASLVGIGLNIYPPEAAAIPESFQGAFLTSNQSPVTNHQLASAIWACLQPHVALYGKEGWSQSLHDSYLQRCVTIGQSIRWRIPQEGGSTAEIQELTGHARGLTPSGHLEMVEEDGTVHVIHSGEIFDKR